MASPHNRIVSDGFNTASAQPQFHKLFIVFMVLCLSNLLCYCFVLLTPIKIRVSETFVHETGKTILIDYALTNSAVNRYQTVLKVIL